MKTDYMRIIGKCLLGVVLAVAVFACKDDNSAADSSTLQLLSYTPSAGSGIYYNDTITLTFNQAVRQTADSLITINNQATTIIINGATVYCHVDAPTATTVSLNIPAGALVDRSGTKSFAGTTLNYNIVAEKQEIVVVDCDGNGDYTTITDALFDVSSSNDSPYIIFIANGTYEELVEVNKPYVHLIGQDWTNTVITYKTCRLSENNSSYVDSEGHTAWEYSSRNPANINNIPENRDGVTLITGQNFYAENISFENKWGVETQQGPQAEALHTRADRIAFYHCKFRGFQDTWWTRCYTSGSSENINMRNYADNCWIEGGTDYVFGGGNILIENSTFYNVGTANYMTAGSHMSSTTWGYVIKNCKVSGNSTAAQASVNVKSGNSGIYFGRAWQNSPKTVFINTNCLLPVCDEGWYTMSALPALYAEYNTTYQGWPVDTSSRRTLYNVDEDYSESGVDETNVEYTGDLVLSEAQAATYTYDNIIKADDDWDPQAYYEKLQDPTVTMTNSTLSWEDDSDAICYLIFKDGDYFGKTTSTTYLVDDTDATYEVKAMNRYGSLSE